MADRLEAEFSVASIEEKPGAMGYVVHLAGHFPSATTQAFDKAYLAITDETFPVEEMALEEPLDSQVREVRRDIASTRRPTPMFAEQIEREAKRLAKLIATPVGAEFFPELAIGSRGWTLDWTRHGETKPLFAYQGARVKVTVEALSVPVDAYTNQPVDAVGTVLHAPVAGRRI